jgi:hypothetical protein
MHSPGASPCPTSLAAKRLDLFVGEIQKNTALLLIKQPPRPLLVAPTVHAAKHSSSRPANRPIAHHGEVLLMRRFAANRRPRETSMVFSTPKSHLEMSTYLGHVPLIEKVPDKRQEGVLIV